MIGRTAIVIVSLFVSTSVWAEECTEHWLAGEGIPGINGHITCLTTWDPDGNGPAKELLIAGGKFTIAGNVEANNIAAWDGQNWHALGGGTNDYVIALAVYKGELIAGGNFTGAGDESANHIARWDGANWHALGAGLDNTVVTFAVYNNELIAGGYFKNSGDISVSCIARWNGSNWQDVGGGAAEVYFPTVDTLLVSDNELIAGGSFTSMGRTKANCVAKWDGKKWRPLDKKIITGVSYVNELAAVNGQLVSSGLYTVPGDYNCRGFFSVWDKNRWNILENGPGREYDGLSVFNGELALKRRIDRTETVSVWNGSGWGEIGEFEGTIYDTVVYDGQLIAAGEFTKVNGVYLNNIAVWNGTNWAALGRGLPAYITDFTIFNNELIAGSTSIYKWNGLEWELFSTPEPNSSYRIDSFTVFNSDLVAARECYRQSGYSFDVAKWNGSSWETFGSGSFNAIFAMENYGGDLIVAGGFGEINGITVNNIARWDGTNWHGFGSYIGEINSLITYDGTLIAAGWFTYAGNGEANHIAAWDGANWIPLGSGTNGMCVNALTVYDGKLIAGGSFSEAGGVSANNIAAWDGSQWHPLGSGIDGDVFSLAVHNGKLFAGGSNQLLVWDGNSWQMVGGGINGGIGKLISFDDQLFAAGDFTKIGDQISVYWARWGCDK